MFFFSYYFITLKVAMMCLANNNIIPQFICKALKLKAF